MSDPTAPWTPTSAPPIREHFQEAARGHQQEGSVGKGQEDEQLKQQLEAQRATPEHERHYRPDDTRVQEVHTKHEAEREAFIKKMSKEPEQDFGPKV